MFKKQIQNGRNLERLEISEFGGLNTAAFASDKEFSELLNLTNEEWPYLVTKEPGESIHIDNWDIDMVKNANIKPQLLAKDKEGLFEEGKITAFASGVKDASGETVAAVMTYAPIAHRTVWVPGAWKRTDGKEAFNVTEPQEQMVMVNGNYVFFPSMAYVNIEKSADGGYVYTNNAGMLESVIGVTSEDYHAMLYPDGHTALTLGYDTDLKAWELYINYKETLSCIKEAYDGGALSVGDTLRFKYSGETVSGFSETDLYAITSIETGRASSDKYDSYIRILMEATAADGGTIQGYAGFEITNTDINKGEKELTVIKTNPFKLGCSFGGRLFCCDVSGNSVWVSKFGEPFDFSVDATDAGGAVLSCLEPLRWTAIISYAENVYCFKRDKIYRIDGSGSLSYEFTPISDLGALNQKAVTVIESSMYFMNESGIYKFSGGELQLISSAVTKELSGAKSAILGGYGHVLYAAVNFSDGSQALYVCDQKTGYWHTETPPAGGTVYDFCDYAGKFMCATSKGVYQLNPEEEGKSDTDVSFSLVTKEYFYLFDKKAVGEVNIRMEAEEPVYISVCYDGKTWTDEREVKLGAGVGRANVKLRKCTTFKIKVRGSGKAKIYAMEFSLYTGGRYYGK